VVDIYTQRSLTIPTDRLPAVGGIAERYGHLFNDDCLVGIWRSGLPNSLLWIVDNHKSKSDQPSVAHPSAPTWSWASTTRTTNTTLYTQNSQRPNSEAEVLDVRLEYEIFGARYGSTISGRLTMRGYITPVVWAMPKADASE
jgi:hypothetical protein